MGTPEFAVESLDILLKNHYEVCAVITAPDKPAGRGQKIKMSAVKEYALEHQLKILQPDKLKDPGFIEELKSLQANLFVVVAFRMLPEIIWSMPKNGTFNLHASLLPQYRGAAPINWAIINGDTVTGVTTFFLQQQIDTGDLLFQKSIEILPEDNAESLHDKLMHLGANLTLQTVEAIAADKITPTPQPHNTTLKPAPKIFKEDCLLDFSQDVIQIHNKVRGLSPFPTAYTFLDGKILKIYATQPEKSPSNQKIGSIESDGKTFLKIRCADGWINLLEIQLEGKKRMTVADFLKGYHFKLAE